MRRGLLIVASLALLGAGPFDSGRGSDGSGDILAFVGTVAFVRDGERDDAWYAAKSRELDPTGDTIILSTGGRGWSVRWRPTEVLHDPKEILASGRPLDAWASAHYGRPNYASGLGTDWLVFARDTTDGWTVRGAMPVGRDLSGEAFTCGSPFDAAVRDDRYPYKIQGTENPPPLRPVRFDPPVVIDVRSRMLTLGAEDVADAENEAELAEWQADIDADNQDIDAEFQPPVYARDGMKATCRMGIPAKDIARHKARTEFRYERVRLHCNTQHAALKPIWDTFPSTAKGEEARDVARNAYNDAVRTCTDTLYRAGWPYTD